MGCSRSWSGLLLLLSRSSTHALRLLRRNLARSPVKPPRRGAGHRYVAIVLRASNNGQGGIMALMSLVNQSSAAHGSVKAALQLVGVFGASMFYGDGVITPAISARRDCGRRARMTLFVSQVCFVFVFVFVTLSAAPTESLRQVLSAVEGLGVISPGMNVRRSRRSLRPPHE